MHMEKKFYLFISVKTIQPPLVNCEKTGDTEQARYYDKVTSSLHYQFNSSNIHALAPTSPEAFSRETIRLWMRSTFYDYGICPQQADYCNTCSELRNVILSKKKKTAAHAAEQKSH